MLELNCLIAGESIVFLATVGRDSEEIRETLFEWTMGHPGAVGDLLDRVIGSAK
jgi:hypothetical protein